MATVDETRPACSIFNGNVFQTNILAFADEKALLRMPVWTFPLRTSRETVLDDVIVKEMPPDAVKQTAPNGDVLLLKGDDEMAAVLAAGSVASHLRAKVRRTIVFRAETGAQDRMSVQFKTAMAAQIERACDVRSRRDMDHSASVNGALQCGCIIGDAVADGTEISGILHDRFCGCYW